MDNLCLPATAKLWLYQHLIVAKLSWPFTSLDLSLSFAKHLQALAAACLKRWSGLPHPANVTILHTGGSKRAGLRITHLATFWKQMQAVRLDILQQSSDSRCSRLYDRLLLRQEQWWRRYAPAVEHACAPTVVNANPSIPDNSHVNHLPRRKRILNIIASIDAEVQLAKLQQLSVQGRWLKWTGVMNSDLSWRSLLHGMDDSELSFSLRLITNTLLTLDNLRRWGQLTTDTSCPLCGRKATLRHILNGCSVALRQGRYTWRHDNVLRILKWHFLKFWECLQRESTNSTKDAPFIHIVPEGLPQLPVRQRQRRRPLLSTDTLRCASDWQFLFDVDGGYNVFPIEIAASAQRPDIVIYSLSLRKVLLIGFFLVGDFNAKHSSWNEKNENDSAGRRLADLFTDFSLTQLVTKPTRFSSTGENSNVLDLISTNCPEKIAEVTVTSPVSDHCCVLSEILLAPPRCSKRVMHVPDYENADLDELFKVARNEVKNASFAQRSAHRDSRIWRPELIEPAAERKRRARRRRRTSKSAYSDP